MPSTPPEEHSKYEDVLVPETPVKEPDAFDESDEILRMDTKEEPLQPVSLDEKNQDACAIVLFRPMDNSAPSCAPSEEAVK